MREPSKPLQTSWQCLGNTKITDTEYLKCFHCFLTVLTIYYHTLLTYVYSLPLHCFIIPQIPPEEGEGEHVLSPRHVKPFIASLSNCCSCYVTGSVTRLKESAIRPLAHT